MAQGVDVRERQQELNHLILLPMDCQMQRAITTLVQLVDTNNGLKKIVRRRQKESGEGEIDAISIQYSVTRWRCSTS